MTYDFVIVGGGFVGLSTAYWLRELDPEARILVLEKDKIGAGASGKNAGFLTKGSAFFYQHLIDRWGEKKALEILDFARTSIRLLREHILTPNALDRAETSSLTLYRNDRPLLPECFGFEKVASPFASPFRGALRSSGEFKIRPLELLQCFHETLEQRNVRFEFGDVLTRKVQAKKTIYCLNAYTSSVLADFQNRIEPRRAQMLRVRIGPTNKIGEELFYDPAERVYFRKESEDQLLIGGKRLVDAKNEETLMEGNSEIIQRALEDYLLSLGLEFDVMDRWSGIMGFTESELPILEDDGDQLVLGGFSGHGMGLGFHAGKVAAEMALKRRAPKAGPGLFTF